MGPEDETRLQRAGKTHPPVQTWNHTYHLSAPPPAVLARLRACVSTADDAARVRLEVDGETFALFLRNGACLRGVLHRDDAGTRLEARWGGFVSRPGGIFSVAVWPPIVIGVGMLSISTTAAIVSASVTFVLLVVMLVLGLVQRDDTARLAYAELTAALDGIVEPLQRDDGLGGYRQ